jgi:hypothetical protein
MRTDCLATIGVAMCVLLAGVHDARGHDGPPYPIVSNQMLGPYRISVWTDPDTTDDGTPGGQFWVMIDAARAGVSLSTDTRARVTVRPLDRTGVPVSAPTTPVNDDPSRQFVALTMDHEGRFAVRIDVDGTTGLVGVDAEVFATYDLRPSRFVLAVYLVPFVLAGFLWTTLLIRRRRAHARLSK